MTNHEKLCKILFELYSLATDYEFDDYRNRHFATPKVELVKRLGDIIERVKAGDFDQTDVK
jgi:hypothetical protein